MQKLTLILCLSLSLVACEEDIPMAVGQLESDRVELIAESNEPITRIDVSEGDWVTERDLILQQQVTRLDLRIAEAQSNIARIEAQLLEQVNGPRVETIAATRANLQEAIVERDFRVRDLDRLTGLRAQNLTSVESVDTAEMMLDSSRARIEAIRAQLAELEAGTREEQIAQTQASLAQAQAQLHSLEFDRSRLSVNAPVSGQIDSLPFEIGERPRVGDVVAVLLSGDQPYARVYVPEPQRVSLQIGDVLDVHVDGLETALAGTVRRIAADPTFTPYFALTERDRSRLSYVAEITLPDRAQRLPEGVPVQVLF